MQPLQYVNNPIFLVHLSYDHKEQRLSHRPDIMKHFNTVEKQKKNLNVHLPAFSSFNHISCLLQQIGLELSGWCVTLSSSD